jgi:hypothetical protein
MIEISKKYRLKKLKGWFEKDSEEFQQTMGQVIKDMGVRLRDTIDRMYDK